MRQSLGTVWLQEEGQDIVEYTLLVAFITFATAALFLLGAGGNLKGIWAAGSTQLSAANTSVS